MFKVCFDLHLEVRKYKSHISAYLIRKKTLKRFLKVKFYLTLFCEVIH